MTSEELMKEMQQKQGNQSASSRLMNEMGINTPSVQNTTKSKAQLKYESDINKMRTALNSQTYVPKQQSEIKQSIQNDGQNYVQAAVNNQQAKTNNPVFNTATKENYINYLHNSDSDYATNYRNNVQQGYLGKKQGEDYIKNYDFNNQSNEYLQNLANAYRNAQGGAKQNAYNEAIAKGVEDELNKRADNAGLIEKGVNGVKTFGTSVANGAANIADAVKQGEMAFFDNVEEINANHLLAYQAGKKVRQTTPTGEKVETDYATTAGAMLRNYANRHPENQRLQELYKAIQNKNYTGTADDLKAELKQIQNELYKSWQKGAIGNIHTNANVQQQLNDYYGGADKVALDTTTQIGNMLPSIGMGMATGGIGSMTTLGLNAGGSAFNEAYDSGADFNDAYLYGVLSGTTEVATELVGGERLVNKALGLKSSLLSKLVKSEGGSWLKNVFIDVAGEATEEGISEALQPLWKHLTNQKTYDFSKDSDVADYIGGIWEAMYSSVPTTLAMGAGANIQEFKNKYDNTKIKNSVVNSIRANGDLSTDQKVQLINAVNEYAKNLDTFQEQNWSKIQSEINQIEKETNSNDINNYNSEMTEKNEALEPRKIKFSDIVNETMQESMQNRILGQNNANESQQQIEQEIYDNSNLNTQEKYQLIKIINEQNKVDEQNTNFDKEQLGNDVNEFAEKVMNYSDISEEAKNYLLDNILSVQTPEQLQAVKDGVEALKLPAASSVEQSTQGIQDLRNSLQNQTQQVEAKPNDQESAIQKTVAALNLMPTENTTSVKVNDSKNISNQVDALNLKQTDNQQPTMKQRRFVNTVQQNQNASEEFKNTIKNDDRGYYKTVSNEESLNTARNIINQNGTEYAENMFKTNAITTAESSAVADLLINKALVDGDTQKATELSIEYARKLTEAGQFIQAASIIKRLSPDGFLIYGNKQLIKAVEEIKKENKNWYKKLKDEGIITNVNGIDTIALTEDEINTIKKNMEQVQKMPDGREKDILVAKTMNIIGNKIPASALEKVASIRRSGLLLNLKTLNRNVGANLAFGGLEMAKDVPAAMLDRLVSLATGQRTTALPSVSAYFKGGKKGTVISIEDVYNGINTENGGAGKFSTGQKGKAWKRENTYKEVLDMYKQGQTTEALKATFKRFLSDYEDISTWIVDGTDKPFWYGRFEQELQRQMKLNNLEYGIDIPTNEMLEIARDEADYATFKNKNVISDVFGGFRRLANLGKPIGAADALGFTFTNVPGSIATKIYDYTAGGYLKAAKELVNVATKGNEFNQRKFVDGLARSITGTGVINLAAYLVSKGILRGGEDDDKDIANMEKQLGYQENSINISALQRLIKGEDTAVRQGDKFYTFDWVQPFSGLWIVGADMQKAKDKGGDVLKAGFTSAVDQIFDMSSLSTAQKIFSSYGTPGENILTTVLDFPASFIGTLSNNIAQYNDEYSRITKSDNIFETALNRIKNKITGQRETLSKKSDTLGNDVLQYKDGNDAFSTFVDPGYKTTYSSNELQQGLLDVYKETGNKNIFPTQTDRSITYSIDKVSNTKKLTTDEQYTYQKATGAYSNEVMTDLFESDAFMKFTAEDKAKALEKVVEDSLIVGKKSVDVETSKYAKYKERADKLENAGIPLADYYIAWTATQTKDKKTSTKKAIADATGLSSYKLNILNNILK